MSATTSSYFDDESAGLTGFAGDGIHRKVILYRGNEVRKCNELTSRLLEMGGKLSVRIIQTLASSQD